MSSRDLQAPAPAGVSSDEDQHEPSSGGILSSPYAKLAASLAISLALMFLLSMSMVRTLDHYYLNPSNLWMATVMVAPMGLVMMLVMRSMFTNRRANVVWYLGLVVVFVASLVLGRAETFVGNEGFLRSMIPHHSRAILVCEEADITDPDITALCGQIVNAQREEIREMQDMLERY